MAENTIDNLSIQVTASAENAARVFDRLASSAGRVKGAASGAAGGMQDMAQGARDAGTATQKAGEQSGSAAPKIRGVGRDAKTAGDNAKKGTSGIGSFWQSLRRIAFYRAIRSVIKGITDAFQTGITNLYHWSDAIDGHFAASMDRLAISSLYLKNSLGAMLAPIINTLAPIIDYVVDGLVWIINHINMVFAMLSGSQTYTVAKKVATTWGDAGKSAASSAKKASDDIKRTILGFDEINKLEKQNSSSGGSGSGTNKNGTDYSSMFETKQLPAWMATVASVINKLKLGWAGLLAGILAGWAAIKKAVKAVSDLSLGWLKKMAGKTINIAVSLVRKGWTTITKWATQFGAAVVDLAVRIKTSAVQLWRQFANAWAGLNPILKVGIAVGITALALWKLYQAAWNGDPSKVLQIGVALSTTAAALWGEVQKGWANIKDKVLTVVVKPEVEPATNNAPAANKGFQGVGSWQGAGVTGDLPGDENPFTVSQFFNKLGIGKINTKGLGKTVAAVAVGIVGAVLAGGLPGLAASANNAVVMTPQNKLKQQLRPLNMPGAGRDQSKVVPKNTLPWDTKWLTNTSAKNKIKEFTATIVTNVAKVKTAMFDGTKKAADAVHDFVDKYGQLRDNALGITWERVGTNAVTSLKNGMGQTWYQATASVNQGMTDMYNTGMSKSFKPVGSKTVSDIDSGVRSGQPSANSTMTNTMNGMYNTANQKSFTPIGSKAPREIGNGINSNSWSATNAIWDLMANVQNTADGFSLSYVGSNIAYDIYNGFIENIGWVSNSISNAISNMSNWISNSIRGISNWLNSTRSVVSSTVKRSTATKPTKSTRYKALGGIYANGIWSDIPQYASGTLNAGSLFWAGERGPELVGRAGGRTEVLNKSQLASAMYSAVQAAMAPASANFAAAANYLKSDNSGFDMEMFAEMVRQGVESAMERERDILRQQLETLRQINDKDTTVEVSTSSVNRAQSRMNRRMGKTIVPVGT